MAVAAVALLYGAVARISGPQRGIAGRRGARGDARRGVDVPVQQPRRGDGAADDGGGLLHGARAGTCEREMDRAGRSRPRLRVPGQDARGLDGDAGDRPGLPGRGADPAAPATAAAARLAGGLPGVGGLVRRAHAAVAGIVAAVHRGLDGQQLHEPGAGLQRIRSSTRPQPRWIPGPGSARRSGPACSHGQPRWLRRASATNRRGGRGCSPASSGSRSAGCCPRRCWRWCWCSSRVAVRRAPTSCEAPPSCSVAGCLSTGWC